MITTGYPTRWHRSSLSSTSRTSARRGITLLFTIGLITMFVLLGTTFLVVSVHYFRASRTYNSGEVQRESPRDLQRSVLYDLIRGTVDRQSSLVFQDLGTDMYDRDNSFLGTVGVTNYANGMIFNTGGAYYANQPGTGQINFNIPAPGPGSGLMAIRLAENPNPGTVYLSNLKGNPYGLYATTGAYSGQYMTFLDGPLRGETVKIVDYLVHVDPNVNVGSAGAQNLVKQFIVRPESDRSVFFNLSTDPSLNIANGGLTGSRVLVNSRPFNGRGAGLVAGQIPNANQPQLLLDALLPNRRDYYRVTVPAPYVRVGPRDSIMFYEGVGHMNEPYDAVDFQNMILAGMITDTGVLRILPSFHRPSLVNYWMQNSRAASIAPNMLANPNNTDPMSYAPFYPQHQLNWDHGADFYPLTYREFRRQIIMRPMPWDHPNFTGSNAFFAAPPLASRWSPGPDGQPGIAGYDDNNDGTTDDQGELGAEGADDLLQNDAAILNALMGMDPNTGQFTYQTWDVDNDGDLIPDSIWIDVGFPVQVDEKGRFYKPLAAVLCTDLDGRLNLNANGTRWHQDNAYTQFVNSSQMTDLTPTSALTMRGQGYGPGEISLRPIFTNNAEYRQLLFGASFGTANPNRQRDAEMGLSGRYGPDADITAGLNVEPVPGRAGLDPLIASKIYSFPPQMLSGSFFSYADLRGRFATGLDATGNPIYDTTTVALEPANSVYEIDLSRDASRSKNAGVGVADQPFSPGELEASLRRFDHSGGALPDRLMRLSQTLRNNVNFERLLVTTDSYDLPVPHEGMLDQQNIALEFRDRLQPYYDDLVNSQGQSAAQAEETVNLMIRTILAPELQLGNRMDVNRAFGNGQDDNGNGVIDEHWSIGDWSVNEAYQDTAGSGNPELYPGTPTPFDHDNNGLAGGSPGDQGYLARQIYARHLYVLMMLLVDQNTAMDFDGDGTATVQETPYALAQLAINIVDFRDADAIRSYFEFDLNPFDANAWSVDSDLTTNEGNTNRGVVWGLERPELLMTETVGLHDRRSEDTPTDEELDQDDTNFDQRLRPMGSLFIEIYNPWTLSTAEHVELRSTTSSRPGVDLKKLDYATGTTPVWRIVIAEPDPNNMPQQANPSPTPFLSVSDPYKDPDAIAYNTPGGSLEMAAAQHERTIYFTDMALPGNLQLASGNSGRRIFQPTTMVANAIGPIPPLGFAVLGPEGRQVSPTQYVTPIGRRFDIDEAMPDFKYDETRSIWLNPGTSVRRIQPSLNDATTMHDVTRSAVAIPIPYLSVSEPTDVSNDPNGIDPYYTPDFDYGLAGGEGAFNNVLGTPLDEDNGKNSPILNFNDGTHRAFRMAHLQRLANPLVPFDPTTNPYLTVDSAHIDLTIFHGADPHPGNAMRESVPQLDEIELATSERGNSEVDLRAGSGGAPLNQSRNLWSTEQSWYTPDDSYADGSDQHVLHRHLFDSLGELNDCWRPMNATMSDFCVGPRDLQDPLNRSNAIAVGLDTRWSNVANGQNIPFPWFAFHNRPYVSSYEMTLVPKSRSSRVLNEFSLQQNPPAGFPPNMYDPAARISRYGHLENFFSGSADPNGNASPSLYRVFDFLHVPSKFVQAEQFQYAPRYQNLQVRINGSSRNNYWIGSLPLNTPFHSITERREPGKININTMFDPRVYRGLLGDLGGGAYQWPAPLFQQFVDSRRGYNMGAGDILNPGNNMPTFFAGVFRDGGGGNLVVQDTNMMVQPGVQSTVFRSSPNNPNLPMFDLATNADFNDASRSAYFKEVGRNRLANLVTTRSNVYAIWITLGYFEFDPRTQQLGQELGIDTGKVKRNRSFHIIDRSIPVGMQPSQNNNVDRAILVERFIE